MYRDYRLEFVRVTTKGVVVDHYRLSPMPVNAHVNDSARNNYKLRITISIDFFGGGEGMRYGRMVGFRKKPLETVCMGRGKLLA